MLKLSQETFHSNSWLTWNCFPLPPVWFFFFAPSPLLFLFITNWSHKMPPSHISVPIPGMTATASSGQAYGHYTCIPSSHTHCWNLLDTRGVRVNACSWPHDFHLKCTGSRTDKPGMFWAETVAGTEPAALAATHVRTWPWERSPPPRLTWPQPAHYTYMQNTSTAWNWKKEKHLFLHDLWTASERKTWMTAPGIFNTFPISLLF